MLVSLRKHSSIKIFITCFFLELVRQLIKFSRLLPTPTIIMWVAQYASVITSLYYCRKRFTSPVSILIFLWFVWLFICIIRGVLAIDIYWDFKNFISNIPCLFLPIFGLVFLSPKDSLTILRKWNFLFIAQLCLLVFGIIGRGKAHIIMGAALFLYIPFFFLLPNRKWKILLLLLIIVLFSDLEARSQVIKVVAAIGISIISLLYSRINSWLIRVGALSFYPLAVLLLFLGITGRFNIFDFEDHSTDNIITYVEGKIVEKNNDKVSADTRTFLYIDLIYSAVENNYIWTGRTPARGNDAPVFFSHMGTNELEKGMRLERNKNEFCHPNIFTWMGLIGVILYALIFIQASILALFFCNNRYIMLLGTFTSFNWFYGWIENCNDYNMMSVGWWLITSMCLSSQFRNMSDEQFKIWFQSIFESNAITKYHKIEIASTLLRFRAIWQRKCSNNETI